MATINMNVGGARRGTAPQFQIASPQGTAVSNLLKALTSAPAAQSPAPVMAANQPRRSGNSSSRDAGMSSLNNYTGTSSPMQAVKAMQALAMLSGDAEAAKLAGQVGTVGAIANANTPGQVAMAVAPTVASKLGVPGGVLGLGAAAYKGDLGMGVNSALNLANPMLGAANALFGLITGTTVGTAVSNTKQDYDLGTSLLGPDAGMFDKYGAGNDINSLPEADRLGAFMDALAGANTESSIGNSSTGTESYGGNSGGFQSSFGSGSVGGFT